MLRLISRRLCATASLPRKVNIASAFTKIAEPWSPHIAGTVNGTDIRLAKLKGEFVWHHHEDEDECFLVVKGKLRMQFRGGDVDCDEGEFIVVPRGIEHCPLALSDETHVVLVEQSSVLNTGSAATSIGDHVHEDGSVPLTKRELKQVE